MVWIPLPDNKPDRRSSPRCPYRGWPARRLFQAVGTSLRLRRSSRLQATPPAMTTEAGRNSSKASKVFSTAVSTAALWKLAAKSAFSFSLRRRAISRTGEMPVAAGQRLALTQDGCL